MEQQMDWEMWKKERGAGAVGRPRAGTPSESTAGEEMSGKNVAGYQVGRKSVGSGCRRGSKEEREA